MCIPTCNALSRCVREALGPPSNFTRGKISGTVSCFGTPTPVLMTDYGEPPRHKFVVGVHNPDVPNPCDYALNHDFDFACTFISRPQLQTEIVAFPPDSPRFNQVLFNTALLKPSDPVLHMLGLASPWLETDSNDPASAEISAKILQHEISNASYCGLTSVLVPPPRRPTGIYNYASVLNSVLRDAQVQINILLPLQEEPGDPGTPHDEGSVWQVWNTVQTLTNYHPRLSVALQIPKDLPSKELIKQWFAEPVRILLCSAEVFLSNNKGYPVLSKAHQRLLNGFMQLKPFTVLQNLPLIEGSEASAHLMYIRYLHENLPPPTKLEEFAMGYQDYLQTPLQPLEFNLESATYEIFEKDPVKYGNYEKAIELALKDRPADRKIVVAVVGAGRGPLVDRALKAAQTAGRQIEISAVEKNPHAFIGLQRRNEADWKGQVSLFNDDMRSWQPPKLVDILVSELLGSFGDNELSPECLDGAQRVLNPTGGISIPASYTAHISPIASSKHHTELLRRAKSDEQSAFETPYVVWLQAYDHIATVEPADQIQELWAFSHPNPNLSTQGNSHNKRQAMARFRTTTARAKVNGIAAYFEAVLYKDIELSTRPDRIDLKSQDMFSWFPAYFPLKQPFWVPAGDTEIDVYFWRHTDGRKVWYEWSVEGYIIVGDSIVSDRMDDGTIERPTRRIKYGMSEIHNLGGKGSNMVIT